MAGELTFTLDELKQYRVPQLKILARYFQLSDSGGKKELVERIYAKVHPVEMFWDIDNAGDLLPDETPERPLYSVRIRRIMRQKMKDGG